MTFLDALFPAPDATAAVRECPAHPSANVPQMSTSVQLAAISRAEAKALGLKRFFTGKPCRFGHVAERYSSVGRCVVCNDAETKQWAAKNQGASRTIKARWRDGNREYAREKGAAWKAINQDRVRQASAALYERKKPEMKEYQRQYRAANKGAVRARIKDWFRRNPGKIRVYNATRRALLRQAEGSFTVEDIAEIRKRQRDRCAYCRTPLHGAGHLDHIQAISKGGSNWPRNLQWLCEPCNVSKHDRDAVEFAQQMGFLL